MEGIESWLSDMASEGWSLEKDGYYWGFFAFEKCEPQQLNYRLEAVQREGSIWSEDGGEPPAEEIEMGAEFGWEYMVKYKEFYIYRTSDMEAREMNTDPEIQALSINILKKRLRSAFITSSVSLGMYGFILYLTGIFTAMVTVGSWFFVWAFLGAMDLVAERIKNMVHLKNLCKRMIENGEIDHHKDWRKGKRGYRIRSIGAMVASFVWIICTSSVLINHQFNENRIGLEDYKEDPPFVTLIDIAGGGTYSFKNSDISDDLNSVYEWQDLIAPYNADWSENATIVKEDGTTLSGGLDVHYHETNSTWVANQMAKEYYRQRDKSGEIQDIEVVEIECEVDYMKVFRIYDLQTVVVMQKDNKVIRASLYQYSDSDEIELEEWLQVVAESL